MVTSLPLRSPGSSSACSPDPTPWGRGPRRLLTTRAAAFLAVLAVTLAIAAPASGDWFVIPGVGATFGGQTNLIDLDNAAGGTKLAFQGSVLWLSDGWLGIDGEVMYVSGFLRRGQQLVTHSAVTTAMGAIVIRPPIA